MTPEERDLLAGLFDRMRGHGAVEKDRDAEAFINSSVRQIPDSAYLLVQSVLVQEQALQQADQRIQELEDRVRNLEASQHRGAPAQAAGGSFLGGMFGGGRTAQPQPARPASVPAFGRSAPPPQARQNPWGGPAGQPAQAHQPQPAPASGGGFMRSAMATAAGVAGGMLLANSIGNMMRGNSSSTEATQASDNDPGSATSDTSSSYAQYQDPGDNDPGSYQDSSSDVGGGWDSGESDV